jgi:hypothetical protein
VVEALVATTKSLFNCLSRDRYISVECLRDVQQCLKTKHAGFGQFTGNMIISKQQRNPRDPEDLHYYLYMESLGCRASTWVEGGSRIGISKLAA